MPGAPPRHPALPPTVEAVLLDAGGVLLDLDYAYLGRLIRAFHGPVDRSELSHAEALSRKSIDDARAAGGSFEDPWRDYFHGVLGRVGIVPAQQDAIVASLWEAHERVGLWTVAIGGGPETVSRLRAQGFRVGVVSNAEGQVARDLDSAGYTGMFETVVDSHLVGVAKPDPGIFRIALDRMRLDAATTVYLGDLPGVDVAGARAAGIAPILLDRHDLYADVDAPRLRAIDELPALLDQN